MRVGRLTSDVVLFLIVAFLVARHCALSVLCYSVLCYSVDIIWHSWLNKFIYLFI